CVRALGVWGPFRGPSRMSRAPRLCRGVRALGVWGPFRGPHLDGRLAYERGAAHVARLVHGERPGAVHGTTVVPHHEVAHAPRVGVHELALRGVLREITQEGARLRHRPADDAARVRREV